MEFQRCLGWVMLVVALSMGARPKDEPGPKTEPSQTEPKKTAAPIVVSADTLAQAVQDDVNSAAKKYHLVELQVDGVVAGQSEYKGRVAMIKFELMVKDRKTDKMVGFTVFCSLNCAFRVNTCQTIRPTRRVSRPRIFRVSGRRR
jgi:hypothetical protein